MRLLIVIAFLFSLPAFSQLKKPAPPVYKTMEAKTFTVGDRIPMSGLKIDRLPGKYGKYIVTLSDSMQVFREFTFAHPTLEFRINVLWMQTGRKFPALTEAVKDTLEQYFRKPAASGDNKLYANDVKHAYFKQPEYVKLELEVIAAGTGDPSGISAFVHASPAFPDLSVIYDQYDNHLLFGVPGLPESEALWLEAENVTIKYVKRGEAIVHTKLWTADELLVTVKSGTMEHPVNHGKFWLRIGQLPEPTVYLGEKKLEERMLLSDSLTFSTREFTARYTNEIPLYADYTVAEVYYTIAGKECKQTGSKLSTKILKKIEAAPQGSEIVITKVVVNGPKRFKITKGFHKIKSTPAGTPFPERREFKVITQPGW